MSVIRLARLAVLLSSFVFVDCVNGRNNLLTQAILRSSIQEHTGLANVPDKTSKGREQESNSKTITGPITDEKSQSGVNTTGALKIKEVPAEEDQVKLSSDQKGVKAALQTDEGKGDMIGQEESDLVERHQNWNPYIQEISKPLCRNCKAIVDYEWVLNEYGDGFGAKALIILALAVLIWMLGTTAQDFFVPPLLYWADRLQLPPVLAGATILALGNGSPDIFAVCTAAHKKDLPLALSEMLGSNMFTICVSGGAIILLCWIGSKDGKDANSLKLPEMTPKHMLAFWGIYTLSIGVLAWVVMLGSPSLFKALVLPLVYLIYLAMIWAWQDTGYIAAWTEETFIADNSASQSSWSDTAAFNPEAGGPVDEECQASLAGLSKPTNASHMQTIIWCLGFPSYLLRWACIPPIDNKWGPMHRLTSAIAPIGMLGFCALTDVARMQSMNLITIIGFTMLAFLLGVSIYIGSDSRRALPWFYPALPGFAMLASVIWMAVLASEITALVEAIGFMLQVPRLQLGFTAIAWGNCMADLLVCVATLRKGHATMAISAIFAAPLIDDLVAFGFALIMTHLERGGIPIMCGDGCPAEFQVPLVTSLAFILVSAIILTLALRHPSKLSWIWTLVLWGLYITFLVLVLVVQKVDAPVKEKLAK